MGTRSSVILIENDKPKGYYNQFDGYPEGLGEDVIKELIAIDKKNGWDTFKKNVAKVKLVNQKQKASKNLQEKYKEFTDLSVNTGKADDWYCLLRNLQGESYIPAIMSGKVEHMLDGTNFVKDSLFCEYAYVVDLDKMVLELYEGFQEKPQTGNRFGATLAKGETKYYPCAKVGEIALKGISKNKKAIKQMMDAYIKEVKK